jgi:hypothetical protein
MRAVDEPIPPDEWLYRWVTADEVNGTEVLPTAIDSSGTSVDRSKYRTGHPPNQPGRPERNGVAGTTESRFPSDLVANDIEYEFFTVDLPEATNDAHAEIRSGRKATAGRSNDRPTGFKPKSEPTRSMLKARLAEAMVVLRAP